MQLSIVTPLYNCLDLTQAFVAALPGTLPPGMAWECLLVDDGSMDGTREWLRSLQPPFRALSHERNLGFAAACNRGAATATGEFLALLNNDLELTPGWLEPMLGALQRGPKIGLVGNVQRRVSDGTLDHAGIEVTADAKLVHIRKLPWRPHGRRDVFAVTAACCLMRRADFLSVGGFDEAFKNSSEDIDLALKLRARGQRIVVCLDSVVRHHVSAARGPTSLRDEENSRRLFRRWNDVLVTETARAWMRETARSRPIILRLPTPLGLMRKIPAAARIHARHAVFRETLRWKGLFGEIKETGAPQAPGQYHHGGFFFDPLNSDFVKLDFANLDTAWIRDHALIELPPGFPTRNFFVNGFILASDPAKPESQGSLGLSLRLNGVQTAEFFPLPENHFNLGINAPIVLPDQATRVEIDLLGVGRTNFLAWLGRIIANWPLPRRWREAAGAYRQQRRNRRLRLSQIVADDEVIFDFKYQPSLAPKLRKLGVPAGVNLVGWFRGELGIGESVRCMARACDAVGLPAALVELKLNCLNRNRDSTYAAQLQEANPYPVNIFHLDPPVAQDIDHHHGPAFRTDHYNIAYWAWELPEFPDGWVSKHRYFDEIWCPSEFARAAIAAKVPKPVLTMPHAIDFPVPCGDFRAKFGLPERVFLFLFIYDFNSTQERKNPGAVIRAFRRAFPEGGPAGLVIKSHNPERNAAACAALEAELDAVPGAHLITRTLSRTEVYELQQACDCFVSLHRAEGFGLNVAEAMFLGKPVIATDWSGTAEFVTAANGCPVNYRLVTLDCDYGPYRRGQSWANADIDHAAHWMRRLVEDRAMRERLGAQAAADIRQRFSPAVIGRRYLRRLESFALW